MLIDTHAHLNFSIFDPDRDQVVKNAQKAGVEKIICPGSNLTDSARSLELAQTFPDFILPAVGIHPQQTDPENTTPIKKQLEQLDQLIQKQRPVAIGECGLDFAPAPPGEKERSKEDQAGLFLGQIKLAQKHALPLLIHTRKSFPETVEILTQFKNLKGVFHCYSAGKKGIQKVNQLGFYFGFDGNLTYDEGLQKIANLIPLEKILLETDAPFLAPTPYRGQRNEPAFMVETAKTLAQIKNLPLEKIASLTTKNTQDLLGLS